MNSYQHHGYTLGVTPPTNWESLLIISWNLLRWNTMTMYNWLNHQQQFIRRWHKVHLSTESWLVMRTEHGTRNHMRQGGSVKISSVWHVSVCPRGWLDGSGVGLHSGDVEEIPDEYRVIVWATDDLKLIELKPEHSTSVLLKHRIMIVS